MSDTATIQALIDTGADVMLSAGTYQVSHLKPHNGKLSLHGDGVILEPDGVLDDCLYIDSDCTLDISGIQITGFARAAVRPDSGTRQIDGADFIDVTVDNCGQGIMLFCAVRNGLARRCYINDLEYPGSCNGIQFGKNTTDAGELAFMVGHLVEDCVCSDIYSSTSGQSSGIIIYGANSQILRNHVSNAISGTGNAVDGGEPIYLKSQDALVAHNTVINGNGHGQISIKGAGVGEPGVPGHGATVRNNVLSYRSGPLPLGGVIVACDNATVEQNVFFNNGQFPNVDELDSAEPTGTVIGTNFSFTTNQESSMSWVSEIAALSPTYGWRLGDNGGSVDGTAAYGAVNGVVGSGVTQADSLLVGDNDKAGDFDGTANGIVDVTGIDPFSLPFSIVALIKLDNLSAEQHIASGRKDTNNWAHIRILTTGGIQVRIKVAGVVRSVISATGLITAGGTHLVIVSIHADGTRHIYVDGVESSTNSTLQSNPATTDFLIGAFATNTSPLVGVIDEVYFIGQDIELSDAEELYTAATTASDGVLQRIHYGVGLGLGLGTG